MKIKHLFIWEAIYRLKKVEKYSDLIISMLEHKQRFEENINYLEQDPGIKRDILKKYHSLMETQHILRKILDEENSFYRISFVGKCWDRVDYRFIGHKLTAKHGELKSHIYSFNLIDPTIYIIRIINFFASIPMEIIKNVFDNLSTKNEKTLLNIFKFIVTAFILYCIKWIFAYYGIIHKILNIFP